VTAKEAASATVIKCKKCKQLKTEDAYRQQVIAALKRLRLQAAEAVCCECADKTDYECTLCHKQLPSSAFNPLQLQSWIKNKDVKRRARCLRCIESAGLRTSAGTHCARSSTYTCTQCNVQKPPAAFPSKTLKMLLETDRLHMARCLECDPQARTRKLQDMYTCKTCHTAKPISAFTREGNNFKQRDVANYRCNDCAFPHCTVCGKQSTVAGTPNWRCVLTTIPPGCSCTHRCNLHKYDT